MLFWSRTINKNSFKIVLTLVAFEFPFPAFARTEVFRGVAKENNTTVYFEDHEVKFDDAGNALEAETVYKRPDESRIAVLKSNFKQSLNLPEHLFEDFRTKVKYGVKRSESKIILFSQENGKKEEQVELSEASAGERLQIGCQGFNYYLKGRIDDFKSKKSKPVLFLVPGDLSTYNFVLEYLGESSTNLVDFKVKIENWLLRAFAPELEFKYDKTLERIVWYKGISNIKNDSGKTMNVIIDYQYKNLISK